MKQLKKSMDFALALMVCISLTACGGGKKSKEKGHDHSKEEKHDHSEGEEHPHDHSEGEEHPNNEGGEHPEGDSKEHPEGGGKEHPDDSATSSKKSLTIEQFADAAEQYIKDKSEKNGGYFPVKDKEKGKTLKLKLKKVHRKRLSHLGDNTYFVCADFKNKKDGKIYDIDIFMEGTKKKELKEAKKPMVHKVEDEERFSWKKEDGKWKRKSM